MASPLVASADVVLHLVDFVHDHQHLFFAPVSATWKTAWGRRLKYTCAVMAHTTVPQLAENFKSGLEQHGAVCKAAAGLGKLDLLHCARAYGCPWPDSLYSKAAEGGHVKVMEWARTNGCRLEKGICRAAAYVGHVNALQWAHANGCPWDEETCEVAALGGHLTTLQWLRSNGYPWDWRTCKGAARQGHLSTLQWLRANDCPWGNTTCLGAAFGGHLEVLRWATTVVRGTRYSALWLHLRDIWALFSGRGPKVVPGTLTQLRSLTIPATMTWLHGLQQTGVLRHINYRLS